MAFLDSEENPHIRDLGTALVLAIERDEGVEVSDLKYIGKTKVEKLLYLGIEEFDLPVTYCWYLAGAKIADCDVDVSTLKKQAGGNGNYKLSNSLQQIQKSSGVRKSPSNKTNKSKVNEYSRFYTKKINLEGVFYKPLLDYLYEFYNEYAPKEYAQVYLRSIDYRQILNQIQKDIENQVGEHNQSSLADFNSQTPKLQDRRGSLDDASTSLRMELTAIDDLDHTVTTFKRFSSLLNKSYAKILQLDYEDHKMEHLNHIEDLSQFFYSWVWQHPCLIIAKNTAVGPKKWELISAIQNRRDRFMTDFKTEIEKHRSAQARIFEL
ncbi:hypothetical protein EGO51_14560 [Haloarcula hispanica]|uniref:DUF8098 domain-containing protein n=1 Tax=Haloarcula hispanica TaxID=51589 RepID=A0A5J5LN20_HALHI|nr:hypothetical protein [Haloarcula hispanica]KAA9410975.1 hypothetical protein EGO51_14560 [Haloarcula hispanica]